MNSFSFFAGCVGAWMSTGLSAAFWLARRGHRSPYWFLMGPILGLYFVPIALERAENHPRRLLRIEAEQRGPGTLRVLVALDGSAEAQQAFADAVRILGPQVQTFVLAEVLDYDTGELPEGDGVTSAETRLRAAATSVPGELTSCEVLTGPPVDTLLRFAAEERIDAIVVGKRGLGMSVRLLGSVAKALVRSAPFPVLVGGSPTGTAAEARPQAEN